MKQPFVIKIEQEKLDDLDRRLAQARWPDSLSDSDWQYGTNLEYMKELADYWRNQFNWRVQEQAMNSFSHFRMNVDGFGIHFIHERGRGPNPVPLMMIHGWPGTFWEMHRILPLLIDPAKHGGNPNDSFDVVIPSLPGYGFSDRPTKPGMNGPRMADLFTELMSRLGYSRFVAQGGDWGATISTWLGLNHPDNLLLIHLNYIPGSYSPFLESTDILLESEKQFLQQKDQWYRQEGAYAHIQATRPLSLAFGLNDSPVGLAAWILEKYRDWSDCGGNVESRFSKDELLTQINIYWFTETIHSSIRLYQEAMNVPVQLKKNQRVEVPCCVARFAKEAPMAPREWVERGYRVERWTEISRGGHFAAWEEPGLLAEDLRASVRPFRKS
jgi:pimeloyl-ACP methyl ester carboxylesterase